MQCPIDGSKLAIAERFGIEIDYCPTCRGIWLDRGELDKIISRASDDHDDDRSDRREDRVPPYARKKKGFLGELFDF